MDGATTNQQDKTQPTNHGSRGQATGHSSANISGRSGVIIEKPQNDIIDLIIIGGGINGTGIARDASGRGLTVSLFEQDDLASGTSSASSKLIHGGLRYLAHGDWRLVWDSLHERQKLLKISGHLTKTLRFYLPRTPWGKPMWMMRIGVWIYECITWLAKARHHNHCHDDTELKPRDKEQAHIIADLQRGFTPCLAYSDCWTDDARLVVLNAISAQERGANIKLRHQVQSISLNHGVWEVEVKDLQTGQLLIQRAHALVNAAGPWVDSIIEGNNTDKPARLCLVKGSHIVVPKLAQVDAAYTLALPDERVIFVIPYEDNFSLIGTTELQVESPTGNQVTAQEIDYLCENVNRFFNSNITPSSVIKAFCGVRPLLASEHGDLKALSRDFELDITQHEGAHKVTVLGGKLTAHRKLAEDVVNVLCHGRSEFAGPWTAESPLPGSDFAGHSRAQWEARLITHYHFLPAKLLQRYLRLYGSRCLKLLKNVKDAGDLGQEICPGLFAKEIEYLKSAEWAQTTDDILWRRTKLGLVTSEQDIANLDAYLKCNE